MKKIFSKIILLLNPLVVAGLLFVPHLTMPTVAAQSSLGGAAGQAVTGSSGSATDANKNAVCEGVGVGGDGHSSGCDSQSANTVNKTIASVINVLSFVVGIAAVVMIIIGGLRYVLSNGDSNNVNAAKNTILYAIIGLVVAVLAQVLVKFVLTKTTSATKSTNTTNQKQVEQVKTN